MHGSGSSTKGASTPSQGGVLGLRDLLSSVAQQVESHLHPSSSRSSHVESKQGRRRSRIRSWIGHGDRDKDDKGDTNRSDGGDSSLQVTDTSEDEVGREARLSRSVSHDDDDDDGDIDDKDNHKRDETRDTLHSNTGTRTRASSHTGSRSNPNQTQTQIQKASRENVNTTSAPSDETTTTTRMHIRPDEEETVDTLTGLMGEGFDREVARRILRKYDGDVEKAAGALIEGERGEDFGGSVVPAPAGGQLVRVQSPGPSQNQSQSQNQGWAAVSGGAVAGGSGGSGSSGWPMQTQTQTQTSSSQARLDVTSSALAGRPNTPVIDLTLEDDPDLRRAMQESMSTLHAESQAYTPAFASSQLQTQSLSQVYVPSSQVHGQAASQMQVQSQAEGPVFGPSERPSDPSWAMVPSHQNESNEANFLQNLNRAIEASLETMGDSDALEPFPVEQQLRRDGCPVVLRPSMHVMVYAASILQGLFYVPQVRERMACWRPPVPANEEEAAPPMSGPDFTLWALSEIFTHMDLARLCDLNVDKRLPAFNIEPWDRPNQSPGELSRKFFAKLTATLERAFIDQFARAGQPLPSPRLFHFQYGNSIDDLGELLQETSVVPIDVNGGESNDLIGRLSAQLSRTQSEPSKQNVIFEPSEVVAFELVRPSSAPSSNANGGGPDKKPFTYPKSIYLDQFLRENVQLAQGKRAQRQEMLEEVQRLVLHKSALTQFDGKDTLKNLRSTIFYFENVAATENDPERGTSILSTIRKLKDILGTIEEGIKAIDKEIGALRTRAETLLDCEELQQYKYDLRVVFVHDGLYGRKHLYSYVHDKSCWWKIADSLIKKVPEEVVLTDLAGLHLGAGPYLLLYSRTIPESEDIVPALPWILDIKDDVRMANREFLSQLPPELVGGIAIDEEDSFPSLLSPDPFSAKNSSSATSAGNGMDVS